MYCPTCGTQLVETLSYCNRCGANLTNVKEQSAIRPRGLEPLVGAIAFITVAVLGLILGALVLMKGSVIGETLGLAFVLLSLLILLVIDGSLLRQLSRLNESAKKATSNIPAAALKDGIGPFRARTLPQPVEPALTVTEHTTRTLEPTYRENS